MIECSWSIAIKDIDGKPNILEFDVLRDESPLMKGLDLRRYSNTDNLDGDMKILIKQPRYSTRRIFRT